VQNSPSNRAAVGLAVTSVKPPQPLHVQTAAAPQVAAFLRAQLNAILLELAASVPGGQGNDGPNASRLVDHAELLILSGGADLNVVDSEGNNLLCQTVLMGHVPLAKRLLHLGVDSTYVNPKTQVSVLQLAESQSHRDPVLIAALKSHAINLQLQSVLAKLGSDGPDGELADFGHFHSEVARLLTHGADIHCRNSDQNSPLHMLVMALAKLNLDDDDKFINCFLQDFHGQCLTNSTKLPACGG
jgi:ankyrin repeat protein